MRLYGKAWISILALAIAVLAVYGKLTTPPARATGSWYVVPAPTGNDGNACTNSGSPCATINGAIAKASSGDTIYVAIGTYTSTNNEVVLLNKDITLSGGWDSSFTTQSGLSVIDGQQSRQGISVNSGVTAIIERFSVQNGYTYDVCAGIYNGGTLTLSSSIISDNVGWGLTCGGIGNKGTLTLNNSTVSGNRGNSGAGIRNDGTATLNNSTISSNKARPGHGGGILNSYATLTLNNSTVSSNTSELRGGGIRNSSGTVTLNNSTVSGNTSGSRGGGISNEDGTVALNNITISGNTSGNWGGGISNDGGTVTLQNSILAGNKTTPAGGPPDCWPIIDSAGYNLIGNTFGCTFGSGTGDLTNVNPYLGPLKGSPGYHPLFIGSPAIDAGNPGGCMGSTGLLSNDQRGFPRFGRCDIGAYEMQPFVFPTKTVDPLTALPNDPLTYTITLSNDGPTNFATVQMTDTLPISLTYINNSLTATGGSYGFNDDTISWSGSINTGEAVTITFGATISQTVPLGTSIVNSATVDNGAESITSTATFGVKQPTQVYLPIISHSFCPPIYRDDFSNPGSGWHVGDDGNVRFEYLDNEYRILIRNPGWWGGAWSPYKVTNFVLAVDVRRNFVSGSSYGLAFGISDSGDQFYTFEIYPNGVYEIWRYNFGSWIWLATGKSGSINPGSDANRLKIERNGSLIKAYANDQLLTSISDGSYTGPRQVGMFAYSHTSFNLDVRFDNLTMYPIPCGTAAPVLSGASETSTLGGMKVGSLNR